MRSRNKPKPRHMQHICIHPSGGQRAGDHQDTLSRFNTQGEAQVSPSIAGSALAFHILFQSPYKWHLFPLLPAERCHSLSLWIIRSPCHQGMSALSSSVAVSTALCLGSLEGKELPQHAQGLVGPSNPSSSCKEV